MIPAERAVLRALRNGALDLDDRGRFFRFISSRGRDGEWVPAEIDKGSYYQIRVYKNGVAHTAMAHRIVYLYCSGNIPKNKTINHINGDHYDNRPRNLECLTPKQQSAHSINILKRGKLEHRGIENNNCTLSESDVLRIRAMRRAGYKLKEIARKYGISDKTVSKIARGDRWGHLL